MRRLYSPRIKPTCGVLQLTRGRETVSRWPLWEISDTRITALGTTPVHGTPQNTPTWTVGEVGQGITFNGSNESVDLGSAPELDFGTVDWTVYGLFVTDQTTNGTIYAKGGDDGGGIRIHIVVNDNSNANKVMLVTDDNVTKYVVTSSSTANDSALHSFAAVRRGTTLYFYFDGVEEATQAIASSYDLSGTSQKDGHLGVIQKQSTGGLQKYLDGTLFDVGVDAFGWTAHEAQRYHEEPFHRLRRRDRRWAFTAPPAGGCSAIPVLSYHQRSVYRKA